MDVSGKGCRLRVGESLAHGAAVEVRFTRPTNGNAGGTATVAGVVVWTRLEGLSYQAGIHFPADDAALAELIAALD